MALQVVAACWSGCWLQWEEHLDEDVLTEHRRHATGLPGDVLSIAIFPPNALATGAHRPAFTF